MVQKRSTFLQEPFWTVPLVTRGTASIFGFYQIPQHFKTRAGQPTRSLIKISTFSAMLFPGLYAKVTMPRDFEAAIAWLLWMLGFSAIQLGHTKRSNQDAADIVLATPSGHFAVVECTIGLLKSDQKLSLLYERAQAVRRTFDGSKFNHLHVIPVIITAKPRAEIEADLEQAEKLGILVLAREQIDELINRTLTLPNPDQYYEEALQAIQAARAKYGPNEPSPIPQPLTTA